MLADRHFGSSYRTATVARIDLTYAVRAGNVGVGIERFLSDLREGMRNVNLFDLTPAPKLLSNVSERDGRSQNDARPAHSRQKWKVYCEIQIFLR